MKAIVTEWILSIYRNTKKSENERTPGHAGVHEVSDAVVDWLLNRIEAYETADDEPNSARGVVSVRIVGVYSLERRERQLGGEGVVFVQNDVLPINAFSRK